MSVCSCGFTGPVIVPVLSGWDPLDFPVWEAPSPPWPRLEWEKRSHRSCEGPWSGGAEGAGGAGQGGCGLSWKAAPARRGRVCLSEQAWSEAPEPRGPARERETRCPPPARCPVAAHPHSPPPLPPPRLGNTDQNHSVQGAASPAPCCRCLLPPSLRPALSQTWALGGDRPRLPLSGSRGFSEVARLANWKERGKKVWVPARGAPPAPSALPAHLAHDGDGGLSLGLSHSVLDQVVHVLVVEQPDEVEGAEAGRAAQGQVPNHHGAGAAAGRRSEAGSAPPSLVPTSRLQGPASPATLAPSPHRPRPARLLWGVHQ